MLKKFECKGWCGRVFIDAAGLPQEIVLKYSDRKRAPPLCLLCENTTTTQSYKLDLSRKSLNTTEKPHELLCRTKVHRRLYKKLRARNTGSRHAYQLENCAAIEYEEDYDEIVDDEEDDDCGGGAGATDLVDEDELDEDIEVALGMCNDAVAAVAAHTFTDEESQEHSEDVASVMPDSDVEDMECSETEATEQLRWVEPYCQICGLPANAPAHFCRKCSTYIRSSARRLLG
jgi:hypothetical protein